MTALTPAQRAEAAETAARTRKEQGLPAHVEDASAAADAVAAVQGGSVFAAGAEDARGQQASPALARDAARRLRGPRQDLSDGTAPDAA